MRKLSISLALGAALLAGCLDATGTATINASAYTAVSGSVISKINGSKIIGANVGVRLPANRDPSAYTAPTVKTDDNGFYTLGIFRTGTTTAAVPDTMTIWVLANLTQPGGTAVGTDSTKITIRYYPLTETVPTQNADVAINATNP